MNEYLLLVDYSKLYRYTVIRTVLVPYIAKVSVLDAPDAFVFRMFKNIFCFFPSSFFFFFVIRLLSVDKTEVLMNLNERRMNANTDMKRAPKKSEHVHTPIGVSLMTKRYNNTQEKIELAKDLRCFTHLVSVSNLNTEQNEGQSIFCCVVLIAR